MNKIRQTDECQWLTKCFSRDIIKKKEVAIVEGTVSLTKRSAGGAFLSENREAYELISDAHPIVTDKLLLAVNGYAPEDGMRPPTFTVAMGGVEGLYEKLYRELIESNDIHDHVLRLTFGEMEGRQTHPLARYSAALAELEALDILTCWSEKDENVLPPEICAERLAKEIPQCIDALRDVIRTETGPRPGSERFFNVSLGACRVSPVGNGVYYVDVFSAGDFSLFLLDAQGMRPLWIRETALITCGGGAEVVTERLILQHPEPFALFLLSKGICEPSTADQRGISEHPGLIWRHRMRMEELFVRLLTTGNDPLEVADAAVQLLAGRCHGWDSVSGAFLICGGSYESLKVACQPRLTRLEHMIALFPRGYDPEHMPQPMGKETVEKAFVQGVFRTRPRILEKTKETLSVLATEMLKNEMDGTPCDVRQAPDLLTPDDVRAVFVVFDSQNTTDRQKLSANKGHIRDLLSEHWLTLRPLLAEDIQADPSGALAYDACLRLQKYVNRLTAYRRTLMEELQRHLTLDLETLMFQKDDWLRGRGGDDSVGAWFDAVGKDLSAQVDKTRKEWNRLSECLRSMRSAYTEERDRLFASDTKKQGCTWKDTYSQILDGTLDADSWFRYQHAIETRIPAYSELLKVIKTLSERNGELCERIRERAAERKTASTIAEAEHWQTQCLLGALREDSAWGDTCLAMIDNGIRNEYRAAVRRWQEETELLVRQKDAFESYRTMYGMYCTEL